MQRDGVVDARVHACLGKRLANPVAVLDQHHVEVVDVFDAVDDGQALDAHDVGDHGVVPVCGGSA